MTTEIAVSNQLGIALATDSAVTISGGGHVKVFNTADKLFELSATYPVAVMINGNMDCLGTPWEILVKEFRSHEGSKPRGSIQKWAHDFLNYVEAHDPKTEEIEDGYIDRAVAAEIDAVQNAVRRVVQQFVLEAAAGGGHVLTKEGLDIRRVLALAIEMRSEMILQYPIAPSLEGENMTAIQDIYTSRISDQLDESFRGQKLTDEERRSLVALVLAAIIRSVRSNTATGVVVAGYGADDMFPAVFSAEVDGRLIGKLKVFEERFSSIAECDDGGMVTHFAQTDVIERLLEGVDDRFVQRTSEFIRKTVSEAVEKTFKATEGKRLSKKKIAERSRSIAEMGEAAKVEFEKTAAESIKKTFSREFDAMIAMMPKQELIELAEALVSITAIERKATVDEGTVGGPVDVALITKHEGFVWIKRKHHFSRELNPRYFWRKFGDAAHGSAET